MKTSRTRSLFEQAFDKLVEAVEAGKSKWLVEYLKAMGKFNNYSFGNAILINFQCPEATRVAYYLPIQRKWPPHKSFNEGDL